MNNVDLRREIEKRERQLGERMRRRVEEEEMAALVERRRVLVEREMAEYAAEVQKRGAMEQKGFVLTSGLRMEVEKVSRGQVMDKEGF